MTTFRVRSLAVATMVAASGAAFAADYQPASPPQAEAKSKPKGHDHNAEN